MEHTIKQRLIGAVVLVAIAVIFLPGILGQKPQRETFISEFEQSPKQIVEQSIQTPSDSNRGISAAADASAKQTDDISGKQPDETRETELESANQQSNEPSQRSGSETQAASKTTSASQQRSAKTDGAGDDVAANGGWIIQVGSFASQTNARNLTSKLSASGLNAFVRPAEGQVNKKTLYRVYVGPWLSKTEAQSKIPAVEKTTKLAPILMKWDASKQ